jgi:hypothetical protein
MMSVVMMASFGLRTILHSSVLDRYAHALAGAAVAASGIMILTLGL